MDQTSGWVFWMWILIIYSYRKNKKFEARIKALEQQNAGKI